MPDVDLMNAALGRKKADLVVRNGTLLNVLTEELYRADVAIYGSKIVAVGNVSHCVGDRTKVLDADGAYLVPGLIDGHIHIECSKLSITMFAETVVPHGTTGVVSGLDEIFVVAGLAGVREFLEESKRGPLKIFWAAPIKAPYTTPASSVGFRLGLREHRLAQKWPECVGLWEIIKDFVLDHDKAAFSALDLASRNRLPAFGSAAKTTGAELAAYVCGGIRADHESYSASEALEKLRNGMNVMIRESSIGHFLTENIKIITEGGASSRRISFCTDDVMVQDVLQNGHLDGVVRLAIQQGVDPVKAIQMATINCAEAYRIDHIVGSISPGRIADILLVDRPESFRIIKVIANGKLVASECKLIRRIPPPRRSNRILHTLRVHPVKRGDLAVRTKIDSQKVKAISMEMSEKTPWVRQRREVVLQVKNGVVLPDVEQDVIYVAVVERFGRSNHKPVAFVSGFKLREGAIASSNAPDDNNIICIGAESDDMTLAVNHIIRNQGGQVVVRNGTVIEFLSLPIGGIVADLEPHKMAKKEADLDNAARKLGCTFEWPFMYLFALEAMGIPEFAITDRGLIDTVSHVVTDPILGPA